MNGFEKMLSKWNFKKIAVIYVTLAVLALIACGVAVGVLYRERIAFAISYSRLEELCEKKNPSEEELKSAMERTARSSSNVIDVILVDKEGAVLFSAMGSEMAKASFVPTPVSIGSEQKYVEVPDCPNAVFLVMKDEEFLLNSIFSNDFGKIRKDFYEDSDYENRDFSDFTVYMLNKLRIDRDSIKVYVVGAPIQVQGGKIALKATATTAVFFFAVYWVLVALWMYKDAAKARLSPLYWGVIGLFTNIIGLIVYKIYRKSAQTCPACGAVQGNSHLYCSSCGSPLGRRCAHCGKKVGAKDQFCPNCGNKTE